MNSFHEKRLQEYLQRFVEQGTDLNLEQAVCEIDSLYNSKITDLEYALCELDKEVHKNV